MPTMHVAIESAITRRSDGTEVTITRGRTLLWDDDELVQRYPEWFTASPEHARPENEAAIAEPGRRRGRPPKIRDEEPEETEL